MTAEKEKQVLSYMRKHIAEVFHFNEINCTFLSADTIEEFDLSDPDDQATVCEFAHVVACEYESSHEM